MLNPPPPLSWILPFVLLLERDSLRTTGSQLAPINFPLKEKYSLFLHHLSTKDHTYSRHFLSQ